MITIRILFLTLILLLTTDAKAGAQPAAPVSLKVGMVLWRGETRAETGFKAELARLGYEVKFTEFNAGMDIKRLGEILKNLESRIDEFDYIYTFGTTVSRRARLIIRGRVPQIFNIVTDPVGAGVVDSFGSTDEKICGVTEAVPVAKQIDTALGFFEFKKLGVFFNPREKNSTIIRKTLLSIASDRNIEIIDLRTPPVGGMLEKNLDDLSEGKVEVDAVYLPPDSYLITNGEQIAKRLAEAEIKSIGAVKSFIDHGALLGVVVDYYDLGISAAGIIDSNQKGVSLGSMAVRRAEKMNLFINETTRRRLKLELPTEYDENAAFIK